MLDIQGITQERIEKMNKDIDNPYRLNGFSGTFAITDHRKIFTIQKEFSEYFPFLNLKELKASKLADDPELVVSTYLTPR